MLLSAGQLLQGKFELVRELGRGGMGSIWMANDLRLGRQVAIKFIDARQDGDEAAARGGRVRFEREARAGAKLHSRHVVQVHDYGIEGETPYIVMELLVGETLARRLESRHRIGVDEASRLLLQTAKALDAAHAAGVVHRDLKPSNVFLADEGGEEIVKILDFGVAKADVLGQIEAMTTTGKLLGSPHYMSPEQARGHRDVDGRSDLWSIAVILFRALTGRRPFEGDSIGDLVAKICSDPLPRPHDFAPDLPPGVDAFFAKALARDPSGRFQSGREMVTAFRLVSGDSSSWSGGRRPVAAAPAAPDLAPKPEPPTDGSGVVSMRPPPPALDARKLTVAGGVAFVVAAALTAGVVLAAHPTTPRLRAVAGLSAAFAALAARAARP